MINCSFKPMQDPEEPIFITNVDESDLQKDGARLQVLPSEFGPGVRLTHVALSWMPDSTCLPLAGDVDDHTVQE